jgi:DNA-binding response OmpR family regulator
MLTVLGGPGRGSTATLSAHPQCQPQRDFEAHRMNPFTPGKILISYPEEPLSNMLQYILSNEGYAVRTVIDPSSILSLISQEEFDFIVVAPTDDLNIIQTIRSKTSTPIMILSAHVDNFVRALELGADDCVSLPFNPDEFKARVGSIILRSSSRTLTPRIERTITFKPEYYQAGLQILSYFHTVVAKKYPDNHITVSIKQTEDSVTLIIEQEGGELEKVEQALDDYAAVVAGRKSPNTLFVDERDVLEFKYRLELAHTELRFHKQLYALSKEQSETRIETLEDDVKTLKNLLYIGISREQSLIELVERLAVSPQEQQIAEALVFLKNKLKNGVSESDERSVKEAVSILSERVLYSIKS